MADEWTRLRRTTAGRKAFRLAAIFTTILGLCIGLTIYAQMRYVDQDVARVLRHEVERLVTMHETTPHAEFHQEVASLRAQSLELERLFVLLPKGVGFSSRLRVDRADGQVFNLWVDDHSIPGLPREECGYWPAAVVPLHDGCTLLVSVHSEVNEALLRQVLPAFLLLDVLLVIGMLSLGVATGRDLLKRVEDVNETARAVTAGDLTRRVQLDGSGDEFEELGSHFNTMLDKTERLILGMRRVSDNVAHDLRTPLSRIRNGLEVTLLEPRSPEHYQEALQRAVGEVERVISTFNSLMQIARTEYGTGPRVVRRVDLGQLVQEIAELYQDVGQKIALDLQPGVAVQGDPNLLRQALSNLIENAMKFSPGHQPILVSATLRGDCAVLIVADHGPGIPAHQRELVLERFSRLEDARSTPGNGLGLAMVKAVVDVHRGMLALRDNHPGLRVVLSLPRCP